jgi:hypothetical protein
MKTGIVTARIVVGWFRPIAERFCGFFEVPQFAAIRVVEKSRGRKSSLAHGFGKEFAYPPY